MRSNPRQPAWVCRSVHSGSRNRHGGWIAGASDELESHRSDSELYLSRGTWERLVAGRGVGWTRQCVGHSGNASRLALCSMTPAPSPAIRGCEYRLRWNIAGANVNSKYGMFQFSRPAIFAVCRTSIGPLQLTRGSFSYLYPIPLTVTMRRRNWPRFLRSA